MVTIDKVSKSYGKVLALHDVSFTVSPCSITGLVGLNGAGKTTLLKSIAGIHYVDSGSIAVNGYDVLDKTVESKRCIGFVADQGFFFPEFTVHEYLFYEAKIIFTNISKKNILSRVSNVIELCSLHDVVFKTTKTLSRGYRQRLSFAKALLHDPPVLLLDEPTTGLDPQQIVEMRSLIQDMSKEKAILISTHLMQEVSALCSSIAILHEGKLLACGSEKTICTKYNSTDIESAFLKLISSQKACEVEHEA